MADGRRRIWLAIGMAGFLFGLGLFLTSPHLTLSHLGLVLAIAAPLLAFYRLMKPAIGRRQCPTRPEWTSQ